MSSSHAPRRAPWHIDLHFVPLCLFTPVLLRARSNYNPFPCLALGAQLVALNYQTNDVALQCYRGLFRQNGGCGYVLRPLCLRDASTLADASVPSPLSPQPMLHAYRLTLLCGRLLPKPSEVRRGVQIEPTSAAACCGMLSPFASQAQPTLAPPPCAVARDRGAVAAASLATSQADPPE